MQDVKIVIVLFIQQLLSIATDVVQSVQSVKFYTSIETMISVKIVIEVIKLASKLIALEEKQSS